MVSQYSNRWGAAAHTRPGTHADACTRNRLRAHAAGQAHVAYQRQSAVISASCHLTAPHPMLHSECLALRVCIPPPACDTVWCAVAPWKALLRSVCSRSVSTSRPPCCSRPARQPSTAAASPTWCSTMCATIRLNEAGSWPVAMACCRSVE